MRVWSVDKMGGAGGRTTKWDEEKFLCPLIKWGVGVKLGKCKVQGPIRKNV